MRKRGLNIFCGRKRRKKESIIAKNKNDRSLLREPSSSSHSGHTIFKGYEKDFGEITETKIQHLNGTLTYFQYLILYFDEIFN